MRDRARTATGLFALAFFAGLGCTSRTAERQGAADSSTTSTPSVAGIPDSLLILPNRIGRIELGMTIAEAQWALPSATFERTSDGDGAALVGVTLGHGEELTLYASESDPAVAMDASRTIEFAEARGADFRTPEGIHPGSRLAEVERTYGRTMRIVRSEIEARQYVEFEHAPAGYIFRLNEMGIFPKGSQETTRYSMAAAIHSIAISEPGRP